MNNRELQQAIEQHLGGRVLGDLQGARRVDGVIPDADDEGDPIDVHCTGWAWADGRVAVLDEAERVWVEEPDVAAVWPPHLIVMSEGTVLLKVRGSLGVVLTRPDASGPEVG